LNLKLVAKLVGFGKTKFICESKSMSQFKAEFLSVIKRRKSQRSVI